MAQPTDKVVSYADLIDDHHEALLRDTPLVSGANALQNLDADLLEAEQDQREMYDMYCRMNRGTSYPI